MTSFQPQIATSAGAPSSFASSPAPTAHRTLTEMGAAVHALAEALGVSPATLAAHEVPDRLEIRVRLPLDRIPVLAEVPLASWFALFAEDLEVDLTLEGIDPTMGMDDNADLEKGEVSEAWLHASLRHNALPVETRARFCARVADLRAAGLVADEGCIVVRVALGKARALALAGNSWEARR